MKSSTMKKLLLLLLLPSLASADCSSRSGGVVDGGKTYYLKNTVKTFNSARNGCESGDELAIWETQSQFNIIKNFARENFFIPLCVFAMPMKLLFLQTAAGKKYGRASSTPDPLAKSQAAAPMSGILIFQILILFN